MTQPRILRVHGTITAHLQDAPDVELHDGARMKPHAIEVRYPDPANTDPLDQEPTVTIDGHAYKTDGTLGRRPRWRKWDPALGQTPPAWAIRLVEQLRPTTPGGDRLSRDDYPCRIRTEHGPIWHMAARRSTGDSPQATYRTACGLRTVPAAETTTNPYPTPLCRACIAQPWRQDSDRPPTTAETLAPIVRLEYPDALTMTAEDVARTLTEIASVADDPEAAHGGEDSLHRTVLAAVAAGHPDAQVLAAAALRTRHIPGDRWYA